MNQKKSIKPTLTKQHITAIERVLAKGDRVELIPGPNGTVKVAHIKRKIVKTGLEPSTSAPALSSANNTLDAPETPPEGK